MPSNTTAAHTHHANDFPDETRPLSPRAKIDLPEIHRDLYNHYLVALEKVFPNSHTQRAYSGRIRGYLAWLDTADLDGENPLTDRHARDYAVRDYKTFLKTVAKRKPATINTILAVLDHFYIHLGLGPVAVRREDMPNAAPRALDPDGGEQKAFLRAVERLPSTRDKAAAFLLYYAGLRLAELIALDLDDVPISARKGSVIVRSGKRGLYREIPLHIEARTALRSWLDERPQWTGAKENPALLLNKNGGRLSTRWIDGLLDRIGESARLDDLSAHVLRHTFATNLLRNGVDIVIVAELLGHKRLDTTRRYTLPTEADRLRAIEKLPVDY